MELTDTTKAPELMLTGLSGHTNISVVDASENPAITPGGIVDSEGRKITGILFPGFLSHNSVEKLINITQAETAPVEKQQQFDGVFGWGPNLWQLQALNNSHEARESVKQWDNYINSVLPSGVPESILSRLALVAKKSAVQRLVSENFTMPWITLRVMKNGGYLGTHAHLEFYQKGMPYADSTVLSNLLPGFELSCLLMLQNAQSGGRLKLYDAAYPATPDELAQAVQKEIEMPAGSLLVFDAAHVYHEVTPVVGSERITAGFWLSYSKDKAELFAWS
ncbi:2OG-Fe(II) oxygenase [Alteromonas sp. S015]|uniref:2OG-Fe(II) oxygenase n=1 Tax=Alteromonas sp. S015 TaxID=3117401 RepID=UPI002FE1B3F5